MMNRMKMEPARLSGRLQAPPSKSVGHRMLLCAALARGKSVVGPLEPSRDILATIHALEALGAVARWEGDCVHVDAENLFAGSVKDIHCAESGSTLRFLIPVAALSGQSVTFTGEGRLPMRPIGIYADCLPRAGVSMDTAGGLPLTIGGRLRPGTFIMPGNVSSQFVTGLLLALPNLAGDSRIALISPLQSKSYVDLTLSVLKEFGVQIVERADGYEIPGNQKFRPGVYTVEGDWSQAAFFLTAGALGGSIVLSGLSPESRQGDRAVADILRRMGAEIHWVDGQLHAAGGGLSGTAIDATDIPDLTPVLAVAAACADGVTEITGAGRLRIKESDRLRAMCENLRRLGAEVVERADGMTIVGGHLTGGATQGYKDHRIVMAMAVAALCCAAPVTVSDPRSIEKSYPSFFDDYNRVGGKADVL